MAALCVECDAELNISERARIGQRIVCPNCGVQLEVISARPLEVDVAYDDGDEWDETDGYSLEDEVDDDELSDFGRLEGNGDLDDELDDLDDEFDDDLEAELDDELDDFDDDLDDDLDEDVGGADDAIAHGRRS